MPFLFEHCGNVKVNNLTADWDNLFTRESLSNKNSANIKLAAEQIVTTPGKTVALKMRLDKSGKAPQAGCNDVLFLYIAAVDEKGTIIPDYSEVMNLVCYRDSKTILNQLKIG